MSVRVHSVDVNIISAIAIQDNRFRIKGRNVRISGFSIESGSQNDKLWNHSNAGIRERRFFQRKCQALRLVPLTSMAPAINTIAKVTAAGIGAATAIAVVRQLAGM